MDHQPSDPLIHFIFIYWMAVTPAYRSIRITPAQLEVLKSLKGLERIHYACELTDSLHMEDNIRHVDWMVSELSWQFCG